MPSNGPFLTQIIASHNTTKFFPHIYTLILICILIILISLSLSNLSEMDSSSDTAATVQHVNKKSSDELLRKFAQVGSDSVGKEMVVRVSKRRKRSSSRTIKEGDHFSESPSNNNGLVERKWLLPPATRRSALLRQLGIGRSHLRSARDINKKSLLGTIEKTWRRTVQGASRVFMEKHYNRHKRLINDVV